MQNNKWVFIISALILSLGIFGAGLSVGKAFYWARGLNRTVTVKGIAERDVKSDLGVWEINYREVGNDLAALDKNIQRDQLAVIEFLKQQKFTSHETEIQPAKVEDRLANIYNQTNTGVTSDRYVVTSGVRVRTERVNLIQQANQLTRNLLQQGIPVFFDSVTLNPNPSYYFNNLDAIRPAMLAETTRSARLVAEQFAKDSNTQLKGIQHASQGIFQIMGRDSSTLSADWNSNQSALGSVDKKVRLVTTIDYRLR
jgi:hypothetical protein